MNNETNVFDLNLNGNITVSINDEDNDNNDIIDDENIINLSIGDEEVKHNTYEERASNVYDALILSLNKFAKVNLVYISDITGLSIKEVALQLIDKVVEDPSKLDKPLEDRFITVDEYLSGNLREKYKTLRILAAKNKVNELRFKRNKDLLDSINIPEVSSDDIYFTLGSPWITTNIIERFVKDTFNVDCRVIHDLYTGSWSIGYQNKYYAESICKNSFYGTKRIHVLDILRDTLNQTSIRIYDRYRDFMTGKPKNIFNEEETMLALEKQKQLIDVFVNYIRNNKQLMNEVTALYNDKFCMFNNRTYDGSILTFPGLSDEVTLFDYQKNAACRIIQNGNALIAHDVGAGKTYALVCAAHELYRLGLSKKTMIVVPNSIIGQWKKDYLHLYNDANILVIEPEAYTYQTRENILNDIIYNDYEAIIIAYSSFKDIELSPKVEVDKKIEEKVELANRYAGKPRTSKADKMLAFYRSDDFDKELSLLKQSIQNKIYFDDLGIDYLFVDEAHNFKNLFIDSNIDVRGINREGSKAANDLYAKCMYIQKNHEGRGVIFATGTPITNSISDIYVLQKYLQSSTLKILDLDNFNNWVSNFAEREAVFEVAVDTTSYKMVERFSKFHNIPELANIFSLVADFYNIDSSGALPEFNGYKDISINKSPEFALYLEDISRRVDLINKRTPRTFVSTKNQKEIKDNKLLITTDGRKAALDIRLIDDTLYESHSKIDACVEKVFEVYNNTTSFLGTQLIFCDISTPKNGFNVYDELKDQLIEKGVPSKEIAFIHSANTDRRKEALYNKVNEGEIRILIGSTFKMGLGVNVQKRLFAIHHLDIPWRPSDITQREGRILRQGNTNDVVQIYRYIKEHSFDAYSWQLLETKQRFISSLLNNSVSVRAASDLEDTVLDYGTIKALAIGNDLIRKRVETYNELSKQVILRKRYLDTRQKTIIKLQEEEKKLPIYQADFDNATDDFEFIKNMDLNSFADDDRTSIKNTIFEGITNNILNTEDTLLLDDYHGFSISLAKNQEDASQNIYLILKRTGKYYLRVNNSLDGNLVKIDNFILFFERKVKEYQDKVEQAKLFIANANKDLQIKIDYNSKIVELQNKLDNIDNKLKEEATEK